MFFTEEKLALRIRELAGYRHRDAMNITALRFQIDEKGEIGAYPPRRRSMERNADRRPLEGPRRIRVAGCGCGIPSAWKGRPIVGLFDFGLPGAGGTGFESLLYFNGSPYHGVDANHQEVYFPEDSAGTTASLRFRIWPGLDAAGSAKPREYELKRAEIAWLDEAADDLYYTGYDQGAE